MALFALGVSLLAVLGAEYIYSNLQIKINGNSHRETPTWRKVLLAILLSSPVWIGLIYLWPIPVEAWRSLPGRELYVIALSSMNIALPATFPLTLSADGTRVSLIACVPIVAIFLAAQYLPIKVIKSLLVVLIICASVQVLFAVLQLALGADSMFYFDIQTGTTAVLGTFANRNHLANFLILIIPICFYVFFELSRLDANNDSSPIIGSSKQIAVLLLLFLGISFILILLATLSRGGLISGFVALGVSMCVYLIAMGSHISRKQRIVYLGLSVVFIIFALLATGLEGIQTKLGSTLIKDADVRNSISGATFEAAKIFWPWGSGIGSFEAVFPRFQPAFNIGFIDYAHNDYAQLLMELGAMGVILMAIFGLLIIHQTISFIKIYRAERRLPRNIVIQCFCGISLLAFLLHCWVEFNSHIPALAITVAFLSGVFLRTPSLERRR